MGTTLLEPAGRGVRLTPAADRLVIHTETILSELERAEASVAASRADVSGTVRIATFQSAAHTLLPAVVRHLARKHPDLAVTFSHISADVAILGLSLPNASPDELNSIHAALIAGLANGTLRPVVGRELPLKDAAVAHAAVLEPGAYGKIVLIP